MLLALMFACTDVEIVDEPTEELEPSPYIYDEGEEVEPTLSANAVAASIDEALDIAVTLDAQPILDGYNAVMEAEEEGCPDYYSDGDNTYWYDYCYTDEGAYFSGYGFGYSYTDYEADGYLYNGEQVYTISQIVSADGNTFEGGGAAYMLEADFIPDGENVPHSLGYSVIQGAFAYDGPEADGTWLNGEISPDLTVVVYSIPENEIYPGYQGNLMQIQGGINGLVGDAGTVVFDITMHQDTVGNPCPEEPSGTISVRDADGLWYDVVYDGVEAFSGDDMDMDECDGCGQVWFRGQLVGDACTLDPSGLLDWEGATPW